MSESNGISGVDFSQLGLQSPIKVNDEKSEKNQFLQLFVAQLRNQNPLEPQEGAEFMSQLAQFSTVEGIKNMELAFNKIAESMNSNQALQASALVGKKVQVKTDTSIYLQGDKVNGSIEVPENVNNLSIEIRELNGNLVKNYQLGAQQKGDLAFMWDGLDDNGNAMPSGMYQFIARGNINNQEVQFDTFMASNVDSVTINKNGQAPTLNVSGFGSVSLNEIKTIS